MQWKHLMAVALCIPPVSACHDEALASLCYAEIGSVLVFHGHALGGTVLVIEEAQLVSVCS